MSENAEKNLHIDSESGRIEEFLRRHPSWKISEGRLISDFQFDRYRQAVLFFMRLSVYAEKKNHHPEVTVGFNCAAVRIFTFDRNEITEKDTDLAEEAERIYLKIMGRDRISAI